MFAVERLLIQHCTKPYKAPEVASQTPITDVKVDEVSTRAVSRSLACDLFKGILSSKVNWTAIGFAALVTGGFVAAAMYGFGFTPPNWMVTAVAVGSYVLAFPVLMAVGKIFHKKVAFFQKLDFEFAALARGFKENHHVILGKDGNPLEVNGHKIFLSAMPNRLWGHGEALQKAGVKAVLSLNEWWELMIRGTSLAYDDEGWNELGIYREVRVNKDHVLLPVGELDMCAEFIHAKLCNGSVAVHCRGGAGRSAMAVAAYLIKYQNYTVGEACAAIKASRPCSTIYKKARVLKAFADSLPKTPISNKLL